MEIFQIKKHLKIIQTRKHVTDLSFNSIYIYFLINYFIQVLLHKHTKFFIQILMKIHQNRSQLIRTSISGNRKNYLTPDKLPVSVDKIKQYKEQLMRTTQNNFNEKFKSSFINSKIKVPNFLKDSVTKLDQTKASTFNRAVGFSHRIMSSQQKFRSTSQSSFLRQQVEQFQQRPGTEFKKYRNFEIKPRTNVRTPLQVINTRVSEDCRQSGILSLSRSITSRNKLSKDSFNNKNSSSLVTQRKSFLKKGTAFDRALLQNVLKSKINFKLVCSSQNYSNCDSNSFICSQIKKQIPNQFKDIIGPQQMLRMSKILSGIDMKTVDLEQKIQRAIASRAVKMKMKSIESRLDDNETLKSIKRW